MLKSYKTEINPTPEQIETINKTINTCRFVYNFYIAYNKKMYEKEKRFITAFEFSKWLNNVYLKENLEYMWIKDVSSKSVIKSIKNAESAYIRFFKGISQYPKLKNYKSEVKMYFVKTDSKRIIPCERHRIKIPTLGWVKIKEKGYIPTNANTHIIKSGNISCKAGRYYVSVLVEERKINNSKLNNFGLGIDLGIKEFIVVSNGMVYKNINKSKEIKRLEKKLKREQRCLSRKYETLKNNKNNIEYIKQNIKKQELKIQTLYYKLTNIRTDYINKCINEIVKTKPSYITIENLNVKGMIKNRHISKAISSQKFYEFRLKLENKCKQLGIELRVVDRWYPSSKICNRCGKIKKDLKLSDREYICECGYRIDRDLNAALNLRDATIYTIV